MHAHFLSAYAFTSGLLVLSLAYLLSSTDRSYPLMRVFIVFSAGALVWNAGYAAMHLTTDRATALMFYRLSSFGWAIAPSNMLYYAYRTRREFGAARSKPIPWYLFALPVPPVIWGVFAGRIMAYDLNVSDNGWIESIAPEALGNHLFLGLLVLSLVTMIVSMVRTRLVTSSRRYRLHVRIVAVPLAALVAATAVIHVYLPALQRQPTPPYVQVLLGAWGVAVTTLLRRYPVLTISPRIASETIVEAMTDACIMTDVEGMIRSANPAVEELFGRDRAKLLGTAAHELVGAAVWARLCYATASTRRIHRFEADLETGLGETVLCTVSGKPITDTLGDEVGYVVIVHEQREMQRLRLLSEVDPLTGAFNRRKLDAVSSGDNHALILFDLDRFKSVNDRFGHEAGDRILVRTGQIVRSVVRDDDLFVRWGGEEFLVLCPDLSDSDAMRLAERLRAAIAEADFGIGEPVTASFGVAPAAGEENPEALFRRADAAMYRAKQSGRNRVERG